MWLITAENNLKLNYPFTISRYTYFTQPNVVIELHHDGYTGYGEATVNPYYQITIQNLKSAFEDINDRLKNYTFSTPDQLYDDFTDLLEVNSFALAALNNASWDLYSKMHNKPVRDLIDLPKGNQPLTSYTLGIDTPERMLEKMQTLPWPIYKIKLGTEEDLLLIETLRNDTDSIIRVDANCAWDSAGTIQISKRLKDLDVEFIEQPLARGDADQNECYRKSALPLLADESCCTESDVEKCANNFHGINIKLLKCGGISPAVRMIKNARKLGLQIMVGCMTESSIGIAAAFQLLPFVDFADLDGPLLLAEDLADGVYFNNGEIRMSGNIGLGINYIGKKID